MRDEKSNFRVYSTLAKASHVAKPANITDLLRRSKAEEYREKTLKIYSILGFFGLIILFLIIAYL